tara:strand:- start:409 stop:684 length:276 start_codon:yes stop_codon:yes gene_type:complete
MPVNYTGNHKLLEYARNAVISALEEYSSHEDEIDIDIDVQEKLEALAYAFGECVLSAMDTDDQGKAQAQFTISTATQLAYLDSITPDSQEN